MKKLNKVAEEYLKMSKAGKGACDCGEANCPECSDKEDSSDDMSDTKEESGEPEHKGKKGPSITVSIELGHKKFKK